MSGYKIDSDGYNGSITFLISERGATIEIEDRASSVEFVRIELDVQQLAELLSRRSNLPCNIETRCLEKVGKKMVMETFEFEIPKVEYEHRKAVAVAESRKQCPKGWEPDTYYGSQNSFFTKDKKEYARTTIRKWE